MSDNPVEITLNDDQRVVLRIPGLRPNSLSMCFSLTRDELVSLVAAAIPLCQTRFGLERQAVDALAPLMWRPNVTAFLNYENTLLLFQSRPDHPYFPRKWALPEEYPLTINTDLDDTMLVIFTKHGFESNHDYEELATCWNKAAPGGPTVHVVCWCEVDEMPPGARRMSRAKFLESDEVPPHQKNIVETATQCLRLRA